MKGFFKKEHASSRRKNEILSDEDFTRLKGQLILRVENVMSALRGMEVDSRQLDSEELFYLFANIYSPSVLKKKIPISGAIAGFS